MNVIIKSDERRANEAYVLQTFGKGASVDAQSREAAECIAAKTNEAMNQLKRMEDRRK